MLKFFNIFLTVVLVSVLVLLGGWQVTPSYLGREFEERLGAQVGGKVRIASLQIRRIWPLEVALQTITLESARWTARVSELTLAVGYQNQKWRVDLHLKEPHLRVGETGMARAGKVVTRPLPAWLRSPRWIDLTVRISQGRAESFDPGVVVEGLEMKLTKTHLWEPTIQGQLEASASVEAVLGGLHVRAPLKLGSGSLQFEGATLKSSEISMIWGGLPGKWRGFSDGVRGRHEWQFEMDVAKLEDLPQSPQVLAGSNFRGRVSGKTEIQVDSAGWKARGEVLLKGFSADLKINQKDFELEGPVRGDIEADFIFDQVFRPRTFAAALDLSAARGRMGGLFSKDYQVPFKLMVKGSTPGQDVQLEAFKWELAQVQGESSGWIRQDKDVSIGMVWKIEPSSLRGLEKVFLPLRGAAMEGQIESQGVYQGTLRDWSKARVEVRSLRLQGARGQLEWKNATGDIEWSGGFSGGLQTSGVYKEGTVTLAGLSAQMDLTGLGIHWREAYSKGKNSPLQLEIDMTGPAIDRFAIKKASLRGEWGAVEVAGAVESLQEPRLDLQLKLEAVDLGALKSATRLVSRDLPEGQIQGHLRMYGSYRPSGLEWFQQNVRITGDLNFSATSFAGAFEPTSEPRGSFWPSGVLTQSLGLQLQIKIGQLLRGDWVAEGFSALGEIKQGEFKGQATVEKLFSGSLKLSDIKVPLLEPRPRLSGHAQFQQVDASQALGFWRSELRSALEGRASGQVIFSMDHWGEPEFLQKMTLNGRVQLDSSQWKTLPLDPLAQGLQARVPWLRGVTVPVQPLGGTSQMIFLLADGALKFQNWQVMARDGSEVSAEGAFNVANQVLDMKGQWSWTVPSLKGCLIATNQDSKGRMKIPLTIKGTLQAPQVSGVAEVLAAWGRGALNCVPPRPAKSPASKRTGT